MDDVVNRFGRELADAIAAVVAEDPRIEAVRERAREAGFEMHLSLEAVIGFANRQPKMPKATALLPRDLVGTAALGGGKGKYEISANDKRFLRSLRIQAEEAANSGEAVE